MTVSPRKSKKPRTSKSPSTSSKDLVERTQRSVSRLLRSLSQLMRMQLSSGPVTVQQCYALQALAERPKPMKTLAAELGLHQSTLTRVVEKLERQQLVSRVRSANDLRSVQVQISEQGLATYAVLHKDSKRVIGAMLDMLPAGRRSSMTETLELLAGLLDPQNADFQSLLQGCCQPPAPPTENDK